MTTSERLVNAGASVAAPHAFFAVGVRAGIDEAMNRQREWKQDVGGFGLRYASLSAEQFIGQVVEQTAGFKLHEDNRYFASGQHGIARRFGYAATSALLARHDDGSRHISFSAIGGAAAGAFAARAWQPRSTTSAGDAAISFGLTMAVRTGINISREFMPRLARSLLR